MQRANLILYPILNACISYLEFLYTELSIPILYVTHDLSEVMRLSDYILVLAQGKYIA